PHLEIVEQDGANLRRWKDGSFDAVNVALVLFSMSTAENAQTALKEAMRVLKPGGTIVVTEPRRKWFRLEELLQESQAHLRTMPEWAEIEEDWRAVESANRSINPQPRETFDADDVENTLKDANYGVR